MNTLQQFALPGIIVMFSCSIDNIPNSDQLCDENNGTPDFLLEQVTNITLEILEVKKKYL